MSDNKGLKWDNERFTPTAGVEDAPRYRQNYERIFAKALCHTCGNILAPHEVELDLGDGDELLCDSCLYGPKTN